MGIEFWKFHREPSERAAGMKWNGEVGLCSPPHPTHTHTHPFTSPVCAAFGEENAILSWDFEKRKPLGIYFSKLNAICIVFKNSFYRMQEDGSQHGMILVVYIQRCVIPELALLPGEVYGSLGNTSWKRIFSRLYVAGSLGSWRL